MDFCFETRYDKHFPGSGSCVCLTHLSAQSSRIADFITLYTTLYFILCSTDNYYGQLFLNNKCKFG